MLLRRKQPVGWTYKFAWIPVVTDKGEIVWLEWVGVNRFEHSVSYIRIKLA